MKSLWADCMVGSSRLAGVAVLDLERRVDLPKAPVSGTARRFRTLPGLPSCLGGGQYAGETARVKTVEEEY